MKIIEIESEAGLLQLLSHETTFRGQINANWPLESKLERVARDKFGASFRQHLRKFEAAKIDQFIERCTRLELGDIYSRHRLPHNSDVFEWLSLMQHYGHPTRLIDFTDDVWIALYFALRDADSVVPCAIYGLKMLPGDEAGNKLPKDSNGKIYRVGGPDSCTNTSELLGLVIKFRHFQSPYKAPNLGPEWDTPGQNYGWDVSANLNVRIKRQKGRFLYQVRPDGGLEQIPDLTKYIVPVSLHGVGRSMLKGLGTKYSAEFLFPSFEEKACSLLS